MITVSVGILRWRALQHWRLLAECLPYWPEVRR